MIVSPFREKYIYDNFIELSFEKEKKADLESFKKLTSIELFYLADVYNWDDGVEILFWIIDSDKCDKGTASLIFWRAEPDFYIERTSETIPSYEKDVFELLKKIVLKFNKSSFSHNKFCFDPQTKIKNIDWNKDYQEWGKIPIELSIKTKGFKPFYLSKIIEKFNTWRFRRKFQK